MAKKKTKKSARPNLLKQGLLVLAAAVIAGAGWWFYNEGFFLSDEGQEIEVFEVGEADSEVEYDPDSPTKTWDFENPIQASLRRGGWGPNGFRMEKVTGGVLQGYINGDSSLYGPGFVFNNLNNLNRKEKGIVSQGRLRVRYSLNNYVVPETEEVNSYPDESQGLDVNCELPPDQVYELVTGKVVVAGLRYTTVGKRPRWENVVIKEISASLENVKRGEFMEMEFDLGEFDTDTLQIKSVRWYPVVGYAVSAGNKLLTVSFKNSVYNRNFNYEVKIDNIDYWVQKYSQ